MTRSRLIACLVCFNLALAAAIGFVVPNRRAKPASPEAQVVVNQTSVIPITIEKRAKHAAGKRASSRFTWYSLEGWDYKSYITNLRAIGCPDETIQDIIIAAVNRDYQAREATLKLRAYQMKPWETAETTNTRDWNKVSKLGGLAREKRTLLKELLGIDVPVEMPLILSRQTHEKFEAALQLLPEDKRDAVRAIHEQYWLDSQRLQQRTLGEFDAEDRATYQKIRTDRRDALAKLLTPNAFEDLELRISTTASSLRSQLASFAPTENEFREIFRLKREFTDEYSTRGGVDPEDQTFTQRRAQASQQVEEQLKAALGPERYAEYHRAQDGNYQRLVQVADQSGLPRDTAVKGYEIQRALADELQKLRTDPNLSKEQRQAAVKDIRSQSEMALQQTLGQDAYQILRGPRVPRVQPQIESP
ncbi:MAG: hypothetical protein ABI651_02745 [Verrucomicrobiota bacterium]